MDQGLLREIATEYLVPLFSGSILDAQAEPSSARQGTVAFSPGATAILFKVERKDEYRLRLTRPQPFAVGGTNIVPEIDVVRAFVGSLESMSEALANPSLRHDLLAAFSRKIVARAMSSTTEPQETLLQGIDQLTKWSTRKYEGSPIAAAIGFRHRTQNSNAPTLADISSHDFSAVLSNGHDTLLDFDFHGRFIAHVAMLPDDVKHPYCPLRQTPLAAWTTEGDFKQRRRVVLCLNRGGEILVFRDGQLLFTRRSGRWSFLTHEPVLTQMGTPQDPKIRQAVYETCLDASFARTGACIGVISSSKMQQLRNVVAKTEDLVKAQKTVKARTIAKMIGNKKFHQLDRRLRQELVSIDGATILSHEADVIAVGAIRLSAWT
jgi:hypothetical protein